MTIDPQNERLIKRAYWVTKLRWIAAALLCMGTYVAVNFVGISLAEVPLYCITLLLVLYNTLMVACINSYAKRTIPHYKAVQRIIDFQISADLVFLAFVLHYSGGIENPFVFYFVFHMIIASILLSMRESFLQATFAVLLFGFLLLAEYLQLIPHYCLKGYVVHCQFHDGRYVFGNYFIFVTTMYLVVYMTSSIATRMRNAEEAYREANNQLLVKDRIKDEYVLRVTHDIKGHLAAIQSCIDVVVRKMVGELNPEQEDLLNTAAQRTTKLTAFVRAILNLTSMKLQGKFEMNHFSLQTTLDNAISTVERKAGDKLLSLIKRISLNQDQMYGNQLSIEEAITNLLLNAIKYTPDGGTITLQTEENGESVRIEVADTGIGIPQEEQHKVFEEFFRASNAKSIERDGTGLGLSIVKQIIESHGGRVGFESKKNVGTKIWFELPRRCIEVESDHGE